MERVGGGGGGGFGERVRGGCNDANTVFAVEFLLSVSIRNLSKFLSSTDVQVNT